MSSSQVERVRRLVSWPSLGSVENPHPTSLFPGEDEVVLGGATIVAPLAFESAGGDDVLGQLLPYWVEAAEKEGGTRSQSWTESSFRTLSVSSSSTSVGARINSALYNIERAARSKAAQFARSAHYMGSKSTLAPLFVEIMKTLLPADIVVLDLMCGSGAATGAFSHFWPTLASDAQAFSLRLAAVQGGGMTGARARTIGERVLAAARAVFKELPEHISAEIETENEFLASDLSEQVIDRLAAWIAAYPRTGNNESFASHPLKSLIDERKIDPDARPFILCSAYYANLFFGVRQSAEIDCLRAAIEDVVQDETEKAWALGALICAISSCAYTYGGHFAQPKIDATDRARFEKLAPEMLIARGLSVSHEFYARLSNLGDESENAPFPVQLIRGPWKRALADAEVISAGRHVCVYLDPPYTRDEYSRYYHVLETLVRYNYPQVADKPSIPRRGTSSRFASEFATRNVAQIEETLIQIVQECLARNWYCLWSYSSSGDANVERVLRALSDEDATIDIFSADYAYKAQGRHSAKAVKEYAILISPASEGSRAA